MFFKVEGTIDGNINGETFTAIASGFVDTDGDKLNHFELSFVDNVPKGFNPIVAGNCWNSSYHGIAMLPIGVKSQVLNLFSLAGGGAYISSRSVKYPTLDKSNRLVFTSNVAFANGIINTTNARVIGTYNGPTDVIGVADYHQLWVNGSDGKSISIKVNANLVRATGDNIPIEIETQYSGLTGLMSLSQQSARHIYGNQTWNGRVMSFDWVGILY